MAMTRRPPAPRLYGWPWQLFLGSAEGLKWNRRDLPDLDRVVELVPQRRVAVQAGGNLGMFPKRLSAHFDTVYTFEPAPDLFAMMTANAPEPNIVRFQAAVGHEHRLVGMARVRRDGKVGPPHEGITHVAGPGVVPMLLIDDLALPVCDLLYLDTEGWELYALEGAAQTVARCRPVIAVEINRNLEIEGFTPEDVYAWMATARYRRVMAVQSDQVFVPEEQL